jgi:hypothetical protein
MRHHLFSAWTCYLLITGVVWRAVYLARPLWLPSPASRRRRPGPTRPHRDPLVQFAILFRGGERVQMSTPGRSLLSPRRAARRKWQPMPPGFFYVDADQHLISDLTLPRAALNENLCTTSSAPTPVNNRCSARPKSAELSTQCRRIAQSSACSRTRTTCSTELMR